MIHLNNISAWPTIENLTWRNSVKTMSNLCKVTFVQHRYCKRIQSIPYAMSTIMLSTFCMFSYNNVFQIVTTVKLFTNVYKYPLSQLAHKQ